MLSSAQLVVPAIFFSYLLTLPPTFLWRDSPEFANVAFSLSIAHPAGFPTYSLLVKPLTFIPFGSIAFKTNLASALFSVLSVVLLFATVRRFIKRVYPSAPSADVQISSAIASLLFALGPIVWYNATITEVYTLNTLLIAGLICLILLWLEEFDPRWLFLSAFLYGLSAGNHATVALFLPGLLALYFINRPEKNASEWLRAVFFFFLGLSVYLYLPLRSIGNPPYDWGDPQNLKNFLYQITDQKDFRPTRYTPESTTTFPFYLIVNHFSLMARQFTPVGIALILFGAVPALRREKGLSLLFLWILFSNHAFFWKWTSGDAFLPSYLALAYFLGIGTFALLNFARGWEKTNSLLLAKVVGVGLSALIVVHAVFAYQKVNRRDYYLPYDFYRPAFAILEPEAVLLTEHQWFSLKYFQGVERLREDISVLLVGEFLDPRDFNPLNSDRHPRLFLPGIRHTAETGSFYLSQFLAENVRAGRSIYSELSLSSHTHFDRKLFPHQYFLFRFSEEPVKPFNLGQWDAYFERLWMKMLSAVQSAGLRDPDLPVYLRLFMNHAAQYLKSHKQPLKESLTVQRLHLYLHGPDGDNSIDKKQLSNLYNSIGLSELHQEKNINGLKSLGLAIQYDPKNKDPYLNLALWSLEKAPSVVEEVLGRAHKNGLNPKELCTTLVDYLFKEGRTDIAEQARMLCEKHA